MCYTLCTNACFARVTPEVFFFKKKTSSAVAALYFLHFVERARRKKVEKEHVQAIDSGLAFNRYCARQVRRSRA